MNHNIPLKWETVINYLVITYIKCDECHHYYQMSYFSGMELFSSGFKKLDVKLNKWIENNTNYKVVYEARKGHQRSDGATKSLFFIYTVTI